VVGLTAKGSSWNWVATIIAGVLVLPSTAAAQAEPLGPTSSEEGPTRTAQAATAHAYLEGDELEGRQAAPRLMLRYRAFQREFVSDFGASRITDRVDPLLLLKASLEQRWGETPLYTWLERGLAFYTWVQSSTRTERNGFDIKVRTGDVADGKLGVHMSRPLGSGTVE
jgi:hypothetical protein